MKTNVDFYTLEEEEEERTYAFAVNLFNKFYGYGDEGLSAWKALKVPDRYFYGDGKKVRTSMFFHHVAYAPFGDSFFAKRRYTPDLIVAIPKYRLDEFPKDAPIIITICHTLFNSSRYKKVVYYYKKYFPDLLEEFANKKLWFLCYTNRAELSKLERDGWIKRRTINGVENLVFPIHGLQNKVNITNSLKGRLNEINKTMEFIANYEGAAEYVEKMEQSHSKKKNQY